MCRAVHLFVQTVLLEQMSFWSCSRPLVSVTSSIWTIIKTPLVYSAVMVLQDWFLQGLKKVMGGVVLEGTNAQC